MTVKKLFTDRQFVIKNNASESVYTHLKEAILKGELASGQELNQVEIASTLGVSRIPVREALRQLASEGLIEMPPNKQAIVTSVNEELLEEIFEIRIALECLAIKHSIRNMSMNDIEKLKRLTEEMDNVQIHEEWMMLNRQFHEELYLLSGKSQLCELVNRMRNNTERIMYHHSSRLVREKNANEEHKAILQACEDRNIEYAVVKLTSHLYSTLNGLKELLYRR